MPPFNEIPREGIIAIEGDSPVLVEVVLSLISFVKRVGLFGIAALSQVVDSI